MIYIFIYNKKSKIVTWPYIWKIVVDEVLKPEKNITKMQENSFSIEISPILQVMIVIKQL